MNAKETTCDQTPEPGNGLAASRDPLLILLTADCGIVKLASAVAHTPWRLEYRSDAVGFADLIRGAADSGLVVLDDEAISDSDRGWMLAQVRRNLPDAMVLYVAGEHTSENEKRARAGGASFYTSKPIQPERLASVLRSFMDSRK